MLAELGPSKEYLNWLLGSVSMDHDGTVADSRQIVTTEFNKRNHTNHSVTDLNHWNAVISWSLEAGMTMEEAKRENYTLWYEPETIFKAEPILGAVEFLYELTIRRCDFIINSSRKPNLHESTVEWYRVNMPFIDLSRIRTGFPDIDGTISKVYRINSESRRIHFEDVPEHAKTILDYTGAHVFLLSNSRPLGLVEPGRLTHITGANDGMPDFTQINKMFFG